MLKRYLSGFVPALLFAGAVSTSCAGENLPARTTEVAGVKVTVAPRDLSGKAKSWDFEVSLVTHTRPLNDDMATSSVLIADRKTYASPTWEGAPLGGHHRKGVLRFKPVVPRPKSVELRIRLAGETAPRTFSWALTGD